MAFKVEVQRSKLSSLLRISRSLIWYHNRMMSTVQPVDESSSLLVQQGNLGPVRGSFRDCERLQSSKGKTKLPVALIQILPLAFLASIAMAATAATSFFTYASLLCKRPTMCEHEEENKYAGAVAIASFVANVCGLLILRPLEKLSRHNHKGGIAVWFGVRSMSVVMLLIGCVYPPSSWQ